LWEWVKRIVDAGYAFKLTDDQSKMIDKNLKNIHHEEACIELMFSELDKN
jgi:hypothetical protein